MMNCVGCAASLPAGIVFCSVCGRFNPQNKKGAVAETPVPPRVETPPPRPPVPVHPPSVPEEFSSTMEDLPSVTDGSSTQIYTVVEPWGEVNVSARAHSKHVVATLLTYEVEEGTRTGLALDGSLSMKKLYGRGAQARSFFATAQTNEVEPIARKMCEFLAETVDCTGKTTTLYWACGNMGAEIEILGEIEAEQSEEVSFSGPQKFGKGTRLMPPLQFFEEKFRDSAFGMSVFVTDGALDDLEEVKAFTVQLARQIEAGQRSPFKGVLIGLGPDVDESQLVALDDLETGTDIDIWDHKLANNLRQMWDIFAEVVSRNQIVAPHARILDQDGNLIKEYVHGLPAILELEVPLHTTHLILEAAGNRAQPQPLF